MSEILTIKPYARLITMLGDQLIKNELIALIELIKNSYDADASWVKVSFIDFNDDFSINLRSRFFIPRQCNDFIMRPTQLIEFTSFSDRNSSEIQAFLP